MCFILNFEPLESQFKTSKTSYRFNGKEYNYLFDKNKNIKFQIFIMKNIKIFNDFELLCDVKINDISQINKVDNISNFNKQPNIAIHQSFFIKYVAKLTEYDFENMCLKIKKH